MGTDCSNIYIISFNAGADTGLAVVSAYTDRSAFQILKNSGRYNATPNSYSLIDIFNLGLSTSIRTELIIEVYANAIGLFDAIVNNLDKYEGPKGDKGEKGERGNDGISVKITVSNTVMKISSPGAEVRRTTLYL